MIQYKRLQDLPKRLEQLESIPHSLLIYQKKPSKIRSLRSKMTGWMELL